MAKRRQRTARTGTKGRRNAKMVFTRHNYVLMIAGVLAVVVGYAMMRIDNKVDGFISLDVAPIIILAGYLEIVYAILWRPKEEREHNANA